MSDLNNPIGEALKKARKRNYSRRDFIKELRRERAMRMKVYARKVSENMMNAETAAKRIAMLEILVRHLEESGSSPSLFANLDK